MADRSLQLLGIARKAGLLAVGGEAVDAATRSRKARAVFSASDASDGAKRRTREDAQGCGAVYTVLPYTKFELGNVTGRGSPGTLAMLDAGLAARFLQELAGNAPGGYKEIADMLMDRERTRNGIKKNTTGKRRTAI